MCVCVCVCFSYTFNYVYMLMIIFYVVFVRFFYVLSSYIVFSFFIYFMLTNACCFFATQGFRWASVLIFYIWAVCLFFLVFNWGTSLFMKLSDYFSSFSREMKILKLNFLFNFDLILNIYYSICISPHPGNATSKKKEKKNQINPFLFMIFFINIP